MTERTEETARAAAIALRMACAALPHLAVLAATVRVTVTERVDTAGVFPSGRIVVNPAWFDALEPHARTFVMAHELLHLALGSHQRASRSAAGAFNAAHDYIINDILVGELGCEVPAGGLVWPDARLLSAEQIMLAMMDRGDPPAAAWEPTPESSEPPPEPPPPEPPPPPTALAEALRRAGLTPEEEEEGPDEGEQEQEGSTGGGPGAGEGEQQQQDPTGGGGGTGEAGELDLLSSAQEREWFPEEEPTELERATEQIRQVAVQAASLAALQERIERLHQPRPGDAPCWGGRQVFPALRSAYGVPWEVALSRWLEAVAPGARTYSRPSRRAGDRTDVVLPGRRREGWTIHVVLDTTGSMIDELPRVLGAIAAYADAVQLEAVHLVQCSGAVVADEWLAPSELDQLEIHGLGAGPLTPAMNLLARDPTVEAVVVVTDGGEEVPTVEPPYDVLWVLTEENPWFEADYGQRIIIDR